MRLTVKIYLIKLKLIAINVNKSPRNLKKNVQNMLIYYISDAVFKKRFRNEKDDAKRTDRIKTRVLII